MFRSFAIALTLIASLFTSSAQANDNTSNAVAAFALGYIAGKIEQRAERRQHRHYHGGYAPAPRYYGGHHFAPAPQYHGGHPYVPAPRYHQPRPMYQPQYNHGGGYVTTTHCWGQYGQRHCTQRHVIRR